MPEVPRNKGQFVQAGMLVHFPVDGSVISHDGTVACDDVLKQEDYPTLFAAIGTAFNVGGEAVDEFRTPPAPTWSNDANWEARVRF